VGLRGAGRGDHFVERCVGAGVGDVVAHRHREQEGLVEHQAHLVAQARQRDPGDVLSVDGDGAGVDVVEAIEEPGDGGLAAPGASDDGDGLAGAMSRSRPDSTSGRRPSPTGAADG
jgi:hypothetical protein